MATQTSKQLTSKELLIRRMRGSDIDGIMPIESVSFGSYYWSPDAFYNEMKNTLGRYSVMIRRQDEKLIGYHGYWLVMDEAHITTIAVDPEIRGQSLGELQLISMVDIMMGQSVKYVTLEVRISNFPAQQLYYKYGFNCEGVRPRYYQDTHEDALIMTTPNILSETYRELFRKNRTVLLEKFGGQLPEAT